MFKIIQMKDGRIGVQEGNQIAAGTWLEAAAYCIDYFGTKTAELQEVREAFTGQGHNFASFGVTGALIFTAYCEDVSAGPILGGKAA